MRRSVLVLALVLTAACGQKKEAPAAAKPAPASTAQAAAAVPQAPQPALTSVSGSVEETLDASDYTYMRLKTDGGGETWAAVTKAPVKKGDHVTVVNAMSMDGFESKTLNRKFDHIVFGALSDGKTAGMGAAATGSSAMGSAPAPVSAHGAAADAPKSAQVAAPHASVSDVKADAMDVKVAKAEGKDAYTVAQVYADRAKLKDRIVTVRGKVVKANGGIMGRNWYHIRDGSGSREKKDDDLTVTSNDAAVVGDVVVVKGVVHLEKDFGAGYQYPVVVEEAKVTKEPVAARADASRP